ncbi:MAG: hypothetical protein ACTS47_02570 [Candidatus Hodgkinia cicadicola]
MARRMMDCTFDAQCRSLAESHINVNETKLVGNKFQIMGNGAELRERENESERN